MNKYFRYILFLPVSLLIYWLVFKGIHFILVNLYSILSSFGFVQNGILGRFLFGSVPIVLFMFTAFTQFVSSYVFVLAGSLIAPEPRKSKSIFLFILVAILGISVFFNEHASVVMLIVQYVGILAGGLKAMVVFLEVESDTKTDEV